MTRAAAELGQRNRAAGKGWETAIARALGELQQARVLGWVHAPQPAFRQVAPGKYVRAARALTDFLAVIRNGGRVLAIEAKSTDQGRLYRSEVKPHQETVLDETADAGGVALLALQFREVVIKPEGFIVPWREVPWQRLRAAESVDAAALRPWFAPDLRAVLARHLGAPTPDPQKKT